MLYSHDWHEISIWKFEYFKVNFSYSVCQSQYLDMERNVLKGEGKDSKGMILVVQSKVWYGESIFCQKKRRIEGTV